MNVMRCCFRLVPSLLLYLSFAAAAAGGVNARTSDEEERSILALAIDPHDTDTVYAGTASGAVFKSIDGGSSWRAVNTGLTGVSQGHTRITGLVIDPSNPTTVYAGRSSGFGIHQGVFKTTNGGESWRSVNAGLLNTDILSLSHGPPAILYAGTSIGGVYRSDDGGESWRFMGLNSTYSEEGPEVMTVEVGSSDVYAGTSGGMFKTGAPIWTGWTDLNAGIPNAKVYAVKVDPHGYWDVDPEDTLYIGTSAGVFTTADAGATWSPRNDGLTNRTVRALAIDASNVSIQYAGTEAGLFKSTNEGRSWTPINTGLTSTFIRALAIDPSRSSTLYVGTEDGGIFKSTNGGETWTSINRGYLDEPCVSDSTTLCLSGGRFRVTAEWGDVAIGRGSSGQAVALAGGDTGLFTFFDSDNVELVVKVLNGCSAGGSFWIFAGGLTDLDVVLTVTDTRTGTVKSYRNPTGTPFQPIQDTSTFSACGVESTINSARPSGISASIPDSPQAAANAPCVPNATTLCLSNSRFRVQARSLTPADDRAGAPLADAPAIALTRDTGAFWFAGASNIEVVVKVLDGCGVNSHHWTFAAGLTNVYVVVTVTDTQTGVVRTYANPEGRPFEPIQDTKAFASCP